MVKIFKSYVFDNFNYVTPLQHPHPPKKNRFISLAREYWERKMSFNHKKSYKLTTCEVEEMSCKYQIFRNKHVNRQYKSII